MSPKEARRNSDTAGTVAIKYEDYFLEGNDFAQLKQEFERRETTGWSLWSTDAIGDKGVLLQFKYPGEWTAMQ
jgi:hypothetical protein